MTGAQPARATVQARALALVAIAEHIGEGE